MPGRPYPPILLATSRRDDRVHPGHARKMAAKLQAMGYAAFFYEPAAGGHGYGKDNRERAAFTALGYAFLRRMIGWEAATPTGGGSRVLTVTHWYHYFFPALGRVGRARLRGHAGHAAAQRELAGH